MPGAIDALVPFAVIGLSVVIVAGLVCRQLTWLGRRHPNAELLLRFLRKLK